MKRVAKLMIFIGLFLSFLMGCSEESENPTGPDYNPEIDPANFVTKIDNPFFPLTPGTIFTYEGMTDEGTELNKVQVHYTTRKVMGVTCVVVTDTVWLEGVLLEATFDWYAQDKDGNVWYFGEDVDNFENGVLVDHDGSWEAGVDGAKPGYTMKAAPTVGETYRQEYYEDEAEDMAEVLSLTESVTVPYGSFLNCLRTREWTPLEPDVEGNKYYAPGIGFIFEVYTKGGNERIELISIETP